MEKVQSIRAAVATHANPDKLYFSVFLVSVITHQRVNSEPVPPVVGIKIIGGPHKSICWGAL